MSQRYTFRPMTAADLPMTRDWLAIPEVARWWDDPTAAEDALADPDVTVWIVSHEDRPFAYLQEYDPHLWPGHHFSFLPIGSRGIDQFIGDPEMLGRGHGSAFIRIYADRLFAAGAPVLGTDPHPDNLRAIRAYQRAGFVRGAVQNTEWGLSLLMTRHQT